ncbi:MAG: helix-turn-helix transcriptional regulator [Piscirickettsiaceae bacterium]|nr:helix-turn-helix transcriptional regulator [Piscirickettsiaceae bacterium]
MSSHTYKLYQQHLIKKRKKLGYSLQALADRSGVSKSIISKIELAQVQPSIQTAAHIADGLGCPLTDMFVSEKENNIIFQLSSQHYTLTKGGHHRKIISPLMKSTRLEIFHEYLDKDESIVDVIHLNSDKYIMALDYVLGIKINNTEYILNKGDSLYLDCNINHSISNKSKSRASFISTIHHKNHS